MYYGDAAVIEAIASNLKAIASNLIAMASNLLMHFLHNCSKGEGARSAVEKGSNYVLTKQIKSRKTDISSSIDSIRAHPNPDFPFGLWMTPYSIYKDIRMTNG